MTCPRIETDGRPCDACAPMVLRFTVPGPPVPKQRARRGKGGRWYTPPQTRAYESHVRGVMAFWLMANGLYQGKWPKDARYRVTCAIMFPDRRRRDADNVFKSLADAGNKLMWNDDSQIMEHAVSVSVDRAEPRLEVSVEVLP